MRIASAFLAGATLAATAFAAYSRAHALLESELCVLIDGRVAPEESALDAWLAERVAGVAARRATLLAGSTSFEVSFAELGLTLDAPRTAENVRRVARAQNWVGLVRQHLAPRPELPQIAFQFAFDAERAGRYLAAIAPRVQRDPQDARLDLAAHVRIPEVPGQALDVRESLLRILAGERADSAVFVLSLKPIAARISSEMLSSVEIEQVLSSYETDFSHHAGPRAINIATAARYLNGTLIAPGATFSFNQSVGPRTVERGFAFAPQIVADELEPGVGGGVCQVASTLHAAAVFGGFEVVQRRSHSRPSGYTPLGLDATVIDGELDLKLRNPYPSTLLIHAFLPTPTSLRIELLGRAPAGVVEHFYEVKEKHEFVRRVVVEPGLGQNESLRHQKGILGYDVVSTVRTTYPDGQRRFRSYTSTYYPVPEVYWVGAGTDPSSLPPLPEGAQGIEFAAAPERPPG